MDYGKNLQGVTENEARFVLLATVYTFYRTGRDLEITASQLPDVINEDDCARRIKDLFVRAFSAENFEQLQEIRKNGRMKDGDSAETVDESHDTISAKPVGFSPELFREIADLLSDVLLV